MDIFNKLRDKLYDWLIDFWLLLLLLQWWKGKERKIFVFTRLDGGVILSVARAWVSSVPNLSNEFGSLDIRQTTPPITKTTECCMYLHLHWTRLTYMFQTELIMWNSKPFLLDSLLPQQQRQTTVTIISLVERRDTVDCCCCCCCVVWDFWYESLLLSCVRQFWYPYEWQVRFYQQQQQQ